MLASKYRAEFSIFVVDRDAVAAKATAESLQAIGYGETAFFPTIDSALSAIHSSMPHIVIFDCASFESVAERFLIDVQAVSTEILTVLITNPAMSLQSLQWVSRGLAYDALTEPAVSSLELLQKVDRAAERLFFQFESEQLREHFARGGAAPSPAGSAVADPQMMQDASFGASLQTAVQEFNGSRDLEDTIQLFLDCVSRTFSDVPVVYFKYVPSHCSLIFSASVHLPAEKFRGIGIDLKKEDPNRLGDLLTKPAGIAQLHDLMREVFGRTKFHAFPHLLDEDPQGIFVIFNDPKEIATPRLQAFQRLLDLAFRRNWALKEKHLLDVYDPVTGAYNRRHFLRVLDEEIARSRRLLMPVSLVLIDVDRYKEIANSLGNKSSDGILRTLAQLLRRSARTNDFVARLGTEQLGLLMPHTAHVGAAVKGERIRRMIEGAKFPFVDGSGLPPVSVSCGVSEYPSLSADAESLLRAADEAMREVQLGGGNRVCISSVSNGFQMDFTPLPVPSSPKLAGRGN